MAKKGGLINGPSTTGKKSGGGRANLPPKTPPKTGPKK
jgi:hypothetical protein